ncbi:MAG TPA: PA0069 family radical SAM protein [Bacteroidia bacterium]|nr:PA0069 family radical SAM protein [Bacteroidia bacterium]
MQSTVRVPEQSFFKGRGTAFNPPNRFQKGESLGVFPEGLDEGLLSNSATEILYSYPRSVINKVESSDIGLEYSLNPYQGCEHGCTYCYARNTHEYWGYSAGLDFERKIIVKKNVIELLEKQLSSKKWVPKPIMLSGNTDCYQPIEREMGITRRILQTLLKFRHPVAIITKNNLIRRDLDLLQELAEHNLVHVMISITGTDEKLRQLLEPRTATYKSRLETIALLSSHGIPCGVMMAPVIPGLNNHEIPGVLEEAGKAGAGRAGMTIVRLNGKVEVLFKHWLEENFPDKADKVWGQIMGCHGGKVGDSRAGVRLRGEGKIAESISQLFKLSRKTFIPEQAFEFNCNDFNHKAAKTQLCLF